MFWRFKKQSEPKTLAASSRGASYRLSILHLGFEDFRKPGSGGGAVRTHEINRRIARHYDITVLVAKYKGYTDRVEDGVRYVHIGLPIGYFGGILAYFAAIPFAARRYKADLIVEDFAPPFSSCLSPLWSRRPTIAMVQWLNAREKSKQYHLPFWIIERIGIHLQKRYIAVSPGIANQLQAINPDATIEVVGNGVPKAALSTPFRHPRKDVIYVGRIEREQKGLDLLLDAYARIADQVDAKLVFIGDGPDEDWLRAQVAKRGLAKKIELKGRVQGQQKNALLAGAKVVAMPSRFETFGMVAIEGFAGGAPVVAFDIPCLSEVIPNDLGILVPPFDTAVYSEALLLCLNSKVSRAIETKRRRFASQYNWDALAKQQQHIYKNSVQEIGNANTREVGV